MKKLIRGLTSAMEKTLRLSKKIIPSWLFRAVQPFYHYSFAFLGALIYRFPSRHLKVVAVTGTKGKSSTVEITNAILEEAGFTTAVAGTVRFKIGSKSEPNLYKMTIPGRFFLQKFLREAVNAQCDYAVVEMTSEGAKQFRHKFIAFDALLFTNLSPEHIESHGSFEKYVKAKLSIARAVSHSSKKRRILVANSDDKESDKFLALPNMEKFPYTLKEAEPFVLGKEGSDITYLGEKINTHLPGVFNISNMLAAMTYAKTQGIHLETIKVALEKFPGTLGRVQRISLNETYPDRTKQDFRLIVDYAHTADSLEKLYQVFDDGKRICVLGNTGGGRDKWKRPSMGKVADTYCDHIILTNEDPYDEDPRAIVEQMAAGIKNKPYEIIMDRREAIAKAISKAQKGDSVLITGKGTDPFIMGPNGEKAIWSDAQVAREELEKALGKVSETMEQEAEPREVTL
jgi:UDP-N-acetylmuramoyl-L-alanyl-D-glutamate--2,6-diaminopimelate ligase